jgi:uncharacterized Zn-binding protein involved in type VI secretion
MPGIVRSFVDLGMGKKGKSCKPCPYNVGSQNVFVEGLSVLRVGDLLTCNGNALVGSPNVFVNGIPVHRRGDPTTCGIAITSSNRVFANGV